MAAEEGDHHQMQNERRKGTVKWFSDQKGFGFITPDDGGEDLFVHHSGIKDSGGYRTLGEGEEVEFDVEHSSDGRTKAVNLTGPDGGPVQGGSRDGGYGGGGGRGGGRGGGGYGGGYGGGGYGRGGGGGGGGGNGCFKCGEPGHLARDCYQGGGGGGGGGGRYGGGGGSGSGCFKCGEDGHFARECPNSGR